MEKISHSWVGFVVLALVITIEARLFVTGLSTDNIKGAVISSIHLLCVAGVVWYSLTRED